MIRTKAKQMSVLAGEKAEWKRMLSNPEEKRKNQKKIVESVLLNMHNFCRKKKDRKKSGKSYTPKVIHRRMSGKCYKIELYTELSTLSTEKVDKMRWFT